MTTELLNAFAKYVIALAIIVGCFVLIYQGKGDQTQPWALMGLIVGWIVRDSAGNQATANVAKIAAATGGTT